MYVAIRYKVRVSLSVSFCFETKRTGPSMAMAIMFLQSSIRVCRSTVRRAFFTVWSAGIISLKNLFILIQTWFASPVKVCSVC